MGDDRRVRSRLRSQKNRGAERGTREPQREERAPGLGREGALVADLLQLLLKIRARESNVAPRLAARSEELKLLAAARREGLAIFGGLAPRRVQALRPGPAARRAVPWRVADAPMLVLEIRAQAGNLFGLTFSRNSRKVVVAVQPTELWLFFKGGEVI